MVMVSSQRLAFRKSNVFRHGRIQATTKVALWLVLPFGGLIQPRRYLATALGLEALQLTPSSPRR